jgi:hypothetical protein
METRRAEWSAAKSSGGLRDEYQFANRQEIDFSARATIRIPIAKTGWGANARVKPSVYPIKIGGMSSEFTGLDFSGCSRMLTSQA